MNGLRKQIVLITAAVAMISSGAARAETSSPAPTASPALTQQEQGYVDMGQAQATQQVQQINANSTPVPSNFQPPPSGGASAGSAKKAQTMQLIAVGASVAAAGYLATKCFAPTPEKWACPMMALAIAQAGMSLASSGGSGKAAQSFSTNAGSGYDGTNGGYGGTNQNTMGGSTLGANGGPGSNGLTGNGSGTDPQQMAINSQMGKIIGEYNGLRSSLEKAGYRVSADGQTVTDPSGRQIPASAFSSPNATASAFGLSGADAEELNASMRAMNAKANDRVKGIAMAVEGGGGSGVVSNATGGGGSGGRGGYGGYNFRMPGQGGGRDPKVSGLSKQMGDSKIGLASDDIFQMVHIRYLERDKNNNFQKD